MPVQEICDLPVGHLSARDAVLWLWVTDRFALEGAGAAVARAWGFEPIRFLVWQKTGIGMGNCPRAAHELCLVCSRGKSIFTRKDVGSVQTWKLVYENGARKHSAKPDGFFDLALTCSPGPYLEMFSRSARLGWDTWGDEALHGLAGLAATSDTCACGHEHTNGRSGSCSKFTCPCQKWSAA